MSVISELDNRPISFRLFWLYYFRADRGGRWLGRSPSYNLRKQLYWPWFCNWKNNIWKPIPISFSSCSNCLTVRDLRPFCRPMFCHSSVAKYTSSLSYSSKAVMRPPNITEIDPPRNVTGWIRPCIIVIKFRRGVVLSEIHWIRYQVTRKHNPWRTTARIFRIVYVYC